MQYGYVRIDGVTIPIDSIELSGGGLLVRFTRKGPQRELNGPITVFGADGRGCWQSRTVKMPPMSMAARWVCNYRLRIGEIKGSNEGDELEWGFVE